MTLFFSWIKSYSQHCSIDMAMGSLDRTKVLLLPHHLTLTQGTDMPIFQITDSSLRTKSFKSGKSGLRMEIVMKRKIKSEMMTTYFPSLLLTAITFATTFFKPFFFEAALSVNLTTMLVMTTIFISKMEGLPQTSDIKMIDIWLILCQLVPFAEVVLLTALEYHRDGHVEEEITKSNVIPITVAIADGDIEEEKPVEAKCRQACILFVPRLKTIGLLQYFKILPHISLLPHSDKKLKPFFFFRKKGAAVYSAGQLHCLFCNGHNLLQR